MSNRKKFYENEVVYEKEVLKNEVVLFNKIKRVISIRTGLESNVLLI